MTRATLSHSVLRRRIVLLCLVLAAVLALLWFTPSPLAAWRRWRAPAPQPPALGEFESAVLALRTPTGVQQKTLQRPLFLQSRRAIVQDATESAPDDQPLQGVENASLRGLVDAQGVRGALVEMDGVTHFVRVGGELPGTGWRLTALEGRSAHFDGDEGRRVLELPFLETIEGPPPGVASATSPVQRVRRH